MSSRYLISWCSCILMMVTISCNSHFSQNVQVNNGEGSNSGVNTLPTPPPSQQVSNKEIETASDESEKFYSKTNPNQQIVAKETVTILVQLTESKTIQIGNLNIVIAAETFDKPVTVTVKTFLADIDKSKELLSGQSNITSYSISIEDEEGNLIPVSSVLQEIITKILLDESITDEDSIFVEVTDEEYAAIEAKVSTNKPEGSDRIELSITTKETYFQVHVTESEEPQNDPADPDNSNDNDEDSQPETDTDTTPEDPGDDDEANETSDEMPDPPESDPPPPPPASNYAITVERLTPNNLVSGNIVYSVTFDRDVVGVDSTDFQVIKDASVNYTGVSVSGSGDTYTFTIENVSGTGDISVEVLDDGTIVGTDGSVANSTGGKLYIEPSTASLALSGSGQFEFTDFVISSDYYARATPHVGDFNADGYDDLLLRHYRNGRYAIYYNDRSGNFTMGPATQVELGIKFPFIIDFDQNGLLDFLYAYCDSTNTVYQVKLVRQNSVGVFEDVLLETLTACPDEIAAADLAGSALNDLVLAYRSTDQVDILEQVSVGNFTTKFSTVGPLDEPRDIKIVNIDNDGDLDVIGVTKNNHLVFKLEQAADGNFSVQTIYDLTSGGPRNLDYFDFSGDGILDIVVARYDADSIELIEQTTLGTWALTNIVSGIDKPSTISAGNADQDSRPDIIIRNDGSSKRVAFWEYNGSGWDAFNIIDGRNPDFAVGNFAGTGLDGLALGDYGDRYMYTLNQKLTSAPTTPMVVSFENEFADNASVRNTTTNFILKWNQAVNGVDSTDFMVNGTYSSSTSITSVRTLADTSIIEVRAENLGTGTVGLSLTDDDSIVSDGGTAIEGASIADASTQSTSVIDINEPAFAYNRSLNYLSKNPCYTHVMDFDGDTDDDIVIGYSDAVVWWENTDPSTMAFSVRVIDNTAISACKEVAGGDIDKDGNMDVCVADQTNNQIVCYINDGTDLSFNKEVVASLVAPESVQIVQLNASQNLEIVYGGDTKMAFASISGAGGPYTYNEVVIDTEDIADTYKVKPADLDGDGLVDLVVHTKATYVYKNMDFDTFSRQRLYPLDEASYLDVVDIDQDGHLDLLTNNPWQSEAVILHNRNQTTLTGIMDFAPYRAGKGISWPREFTTGDYDGDGDIDIIESEGNGDLDIVLLKNMGNFRFVRSKPINLSNAIQAVNTGDFNADGKPDLVVTNMGFGAGYIYLNSY